MRYRRAIATAMRPFDRLVTRATCKVQVAALCMPKYAFGWLDKIGTGPRAGSARAPCRMRSSYISPRRPSGTNALCRSSLKHSVKVQCVRITNQACLHAQVVSRESAMSCL